MVQDWEVSRTSQEAELGMLIRSMKLKLPNWPAAACASMAVNQGVGGKGGKPVKGRIEDNHLEPPGNRNGS
jgi:hypothetical protein